MCCQPSRSSRCGRILMLVLREVISSSGRCQENAGAPSPKSVHTLRTIILLRLGSILGHVREGRCVVVFRTMCTVASYG